MKDHVEISHLTKFHAFRVTRHQVMDLETWFKIHTNFSNVETASPKTILTLTFFHDFCDTLKNGQIYVIFISVSFKWQQNDEILQLSQK